VSESHGELLTIWQRENSFAVRNVIVEAAKESKSIELDTIQKISQGIQIT
jgi:hypothetical protein